MDRVDNPYYEFSEKEFVKYAKRKDEMEANFQTSMIPEFLENREKLVNAFVDLIKLGAAYEIDGDDINIYVNDDIYSLQTEVIKNTIGDDHFRALFDKGYENKKKESFEGNNGNMYNNPSPNYQSESYIQNMNNNPIAAMLSPFYSFMQGMSDANTKANNGYKEYSYPSHPEESKDEGANGILREITAIQKKVLILEQEKDNAKKNASSLQEKYDLTTEKLKDLEVDFNTQKKSYDELENEKNECDARIQSLNDTIDENSKLIAKLNEDIEAKSITIVDCRTEHEKLSKEIETLKGEHTKVHDEDVRKIAILETNLKNLQSEKKTLEDNMANVQKEKEAVVAKSSNIEKQLKSTSDKINEYKMQIDKLHKDIEDYKAQISKLSDDNNEILTEHNRVVEEYENYKKSAISEKEELLKKAKTDLDNAIAKEKEAVANKIKELESNLTNSKGSADKNQKKILDMQKNIDDLNLEKDKLSKEKDTLAGEKNELKNTLNSKNAQIESLKEEIEKLEKLAYMDNKTSARNYNAFNRDFAEVDKNHVILSLIGIRDMKKINSEYGRESGDNVIETVANKIIENFPNSTVYRILGDQFAVITKNKTMNQIRGQLVDTQRALQFEDIEIVYGVAIGNNCGSHSEMVDVAEKECRKMKAENASSSDEKVYSSLKDAVSPDVNKESDNNSNSGAEELSQDEMLAAFMES